MEYVVRKAKPDEVRMGLYLALKVFLEFQTPTFGELGTKTFIEHCIVNEEFIDTYVMGKNLMLLAVCNDTIVGMAAAKGNDDLGMLFVDSKYQNMGIGRELLNRIIAELKALGGTEVSLWASPASVKFYLDSGFTATGPQDCAGGIIYVPMKFSSS